jgi:hypothetical protein
MNEDFMILTADTSNMNKQVKATHMFFRLAILQEMGIRRVEANIDDCERGQAGDVSGGERRTAMNESTGFDLISL